MSPLEYIKMFFKKLSPESFFMSIGKAIWNSAMGKFKRSKVGGVIEGIKKTLSIITSLFTPPKSYLTIGVLVLLLVVVIFMGFRNSLLEAFGGFRGTINVDIGKMQELNQDTSAYIDLQNTDGLIEAFYEDVSSTSYYQTFNLRDMDEDSIPLFTKFMVNATNFFRADTVPEITYEDIFSQRKVLYDSDNKPVPIYGDSLVLGFSSFISGPQYDKRHIYTDANKNPVLYLKQAEVIGTEETTDKLNAYFRDFYNRESTFTLSPDLLYDLNQWAYGSSYEEENIVYPEAFTKPIHFVNDFRRIQTDSESEIVGEPYVYVTKRITLDEIRDPMSEFFGDYEHEGLIYSTPSNIVWDYAITKSNLHQIKYESDSVDDVNVGNVSQYATENVTIEYGDGIHDTEVSFVGTGTGGTIIDASAGQVLGLGDSFMVGIVNASSGSIVNAGVSGESIISITNRAANYMNFDSVLLSAGANDWGKDNITDDYKRLIDVVATNNPNAKIIISNIPYVIDEKSTTLKNDKVKDFNNEIAGAILGYARNTYPNNEFVLVDIYSLVESNLSYKAGDGLHLTGGGYTAWYNKIASHVNMNAGSATTPSTSNNEPEVLSDTTSMMVKLYWKVKDECMDTHMGKPIDDEKSCSTDETVDDACFIGPYLTMEVDSDGDIVLSDLITDKVTYANNNISLELNKCPRRHLQTAPIFDENGNMLTSSRNLFNKIYVRQRTVKPSYRNSDIYWSDFTDFIEEDLARGTTYTDSSGTAHTCNVARINEERAMNWESRECSIIRWAVSNSIYEWEWGKIKELAALITEGDASAASMNISPEGVYRILLEYEDYIIVNGIEGEEWQYKYFATSDEDRLDGVTRFTHINMGLFSIPDVYGIKEMLYKNSDGITYKDTFNTYLEANEYRTVASEYTPVAIVSGNTTLNVDGQYVDNNMGWGWKYDKDTDTIRMVLGEASMEFPDYYTTEMGDDAINANIASDIADDILSDASKFMVGLFVDKNVKYGDVIYGGENFTHYWDNGEITSRDSWSLVRQALIAGGVLSSGEFDGETSSKNYYNLTSGEAEYGDITDFRNSDYLWNPEVTIWRPEVLNYSGTNIAQKSSAGLSLGKMIQCSSGSEQCGRVTTYNSEDDYLPMELKSVRDYGLGSVLSYIEGRKVVFKTGIGVTEEYDVDAVNAYFKELNKTLGDYSFDNGTTGFYPIQLLDGGYAQDIPVDSNGDGIINSSDTGTESYVLGQIYRDLPDEFSTLEDLGAVAHAFLSQQGTGNNIVSLFEDGRMCKLAGEYNGTQYKVLCAKDSSSDYVDSGLFAFVPHITDPSLIAGFKALVGSETIDNPDQFWNPMSYYLAWFDYTQEYDPDDIWSKAAHFVKDGFTQYLDNDVAAALRNIQAGTSSDGFDGISKLSPWLTKIKANNEVLSKFLSDFGLTDILGFWDNAGKNISDTNKQKFFDQYGGDIKSIDLIDASQTQRLYLIEEAATFLGEFMYTYEDSMETIGSMIGEDAQIADIAWADRYYYFSNYIFAQNIVVYDYNVSKVKTTDWVKSASPSDTYGEVPFSLGGFLKNFFNIGDAKDKEIIASGKIYLGQADYDEDHFPDTCWEDCNCTTDAETGKESCSRCSYSCPDPGYKHYYVEVENYIDYNAQKTLKLDAPSEIIDLSNQLISNGYQTTAEKIWINLKVYADLKDWNLLYFNKNAGDLNESFIHDYSDDTGVSRLVNGTYDGDIGDNENHYGIYSDSFLGIELSNDVEGVLDGRTGLKIDTSSDIPSISDLNNGLINDINYQIDLGDDNKISQDDFEEFDVNNKDANLNYNKILSDDDLENVAKTIYDAYYDNSAFGTEDITETVTYGESSKTFTVKVGEELSEHASELLVGINLADRTDEGYPLPLFEHIAGDIKEIKPNETGSYFNGETLTSYRSRISFKDSDGQNRYNYLVSERENRTSYLYDYLMNFEAYVPLDVKSDGDLEVRGYDSLISVRVNYNNTVDTTSSYTSLISGTLDNASWNNILSKFDKTALDKQALSQLIAGIIEVSINNAPERMIVKYNQMLEKAGHIKIKENDYNLNKIENVIKEGLLLNGTMPSATTIDELRTVSLEMESGPEKVFVVPTIGYGGIESIGQVQSDGTIGLGATILSTDNYGSNTDDIVDVDISIRGDTDDRFNPEKAVEYVSTKFARLYNRYGNASYALMAYFYGEDYWNALSGVLASQGGSVVNWGTTDKAIIAQALNVVSSSLGVSTTIGPEDIDIRLYDPKVATDALSYISDTAARTDAIQSSAVGSAIQANNLGENAKDAEAVYAKWKYLIDMYSAQYGVDPAIVTAIWTQESSGSAFAGVCSADNVVDVCGGSYNPSCKSQLKCQANSNYVGRYNGGGGLGQVHDTRGTSSGYGGGGGWVRSITSSTGETVNVTIYNPRTEASSYGIAIGLPSQAFDMQGYMQADTRYDPDISAKWSIAFISDLFKRYDNDVLKAVVSYNRGSVEGLITNAKSNGYGDDWYAYYEANGGQYWNHVARYYSSAISNGTLSVTSGGASVSNLDAYKNTGAYNSYKKDKLGLQNTGIEVYGKAGTLSRNDVDLILSSVTKNEEVSVRPYEYDIFNFFNADANTLPESGNNGDWLMSANIAQLGTSRPLNGVPDSPFKGLPPLFRINAPFGPSKTYKITCQIGYRNLSLASASKKHMGIDIGEPKGTLIYPMAPGKIEVNQQAYTRTGFGTYVVVSHSVDELLGDNNIVQTASGKMYKIIGIKSYYAHMVPYSNKHLSIGQTVTINDSLGEVNNSGSSTGNHLHFEIRLKGQEIDASGNVLSTTDWISVDSELWLTTLWYDESGNVLPGYNIVYSYK